jgi:hypothetical protein
MKQNKKKHRWNLGKKNGTKSHLGYKLYSIHKQGSWADQKIRKNDYITYDSEMDLSGKRSCLQERKGYFWAKSKGYDATMKRAVKEHFLRIRNSIREQEY